MMNRARTRGPIKLALTLMVYCATMTAAVLVAADCKVFDLESPDPGTLSLKDGEHVIASTATPGGKVEVRVVVKGKDISDNQLYLGGKLMRPTPEARVPGDIQPCLGIKKTEMPSPIGWIASAATAVRNVVEAPVEARSPKCRFKCSCNQNTCCCIAFCGGGSGVGCAGY